jgi:hypothetical protein
VARQGLGFGVGSDLDDAAMTPAACCDIDIAVAVKARPWGRPSPEKNLVTSPSGLILITESKLESVVPVTYR